MRDIPFNLSTTNTRIPNEWKVVNPHFLKCRVVRQYYGLGWKFGTVTENKTAQCNTILYNVKFDDDDLDDKLFDTGQILLMFRHYRKWESKDKKEAYWNAYL